MTRHLFRGGRRAVASLRWQSRKLALRKERFDRRLAREALGFPPPWEVVSPNGDALGSLLPAPRRRGGERSRPAAGACVATVCTMDHLPVVRVLVASLRRHHREIPVHVLVVDARTELDRRIEPQATLVPGTEIGFPPSPYVALKLSASELCCAAKPFLVRHLGWEMGFERVLYLDADQYVMASLDPLFACLDAADFVVVPHTIEPIPHPERQWERPSLGDLAGAGVLNAGLFAVRASDGARHFVEVWQEMVTGYGAFCPSRGLQHEQNSFNWVLAFAERVHVLRDTAYNVAYWNLHDRSLRCAPDPRDASRLCWTVDGQPLRTFHFSGYSPEEPYRLSRHDGRHSTYHHVALAHLVSRYAEERSAFDAAEGEPPPYRFGAFPSGIEIDDRMRGIFKEHELALTRAEEPFTPAGERAYCRSLLRPVAGSGSLLPALLHSLYLERHDLQAIAPRARVDPEPLLRWFSEHGAKEYGYERLLELHRPVIPTKGGVEALLETRRQHPGAFRSLRKPLGADRARFLERLDAAGLQDLARSVRQLEHELWDLSPLWLVRRLVAGRSDLRLLYPDLLFDDARAFSDWLELCGTQSDYLPGEAALRFRRAARGRSLARIFSFVNRHWELMCNFPLAFVGEQCDAFAETLLGFLGSNPEFDCDDVVMYLWVMEEKPWAGLPLALELLYNAGRRPSSTVEVGQEELLAPVLRRDHHFREALEAYRRRCTRRRPVPGRTAGDARVPSALSRAFESARIRRRSSPMASAGQGSIAGSDGRDGVNLFGFFKSPIGLGYLSRGISAALAVSGVAVRENLLGNLAMDEDLEIEDFIGRHDATFGTNLFVSYPHLEDDLLRLFPEEVIAGRRNVAYLAWEQSEGNPLWRHTYAGYDQVWALSRFAGSSLESCLERPVSVVPCPLDVAGLPPPARRGKFGIENGRMTFLYVLDANSSIERKNPEAAVKAFERAFRGDDEVLLVLRISNAHRAEHGPRLRRLARLVSESSLDIRILSAPMSRADLLGLISAADCYVSLHRAEGFGFTCAEAMAYAKPTIATGYSGNLEFMDTTNSLLVDFVETEVRVPDGPFRRGSTWAEPSTEHAAHLMRWILERPDEARSVGEHGRAAVATLLDPRRVGVQAAKRLHDERNDSAAQTPSLANGKAILGSGGDRRHV